MMKDRFHEELLQLSKHLIEMGYFALAMLEQGFQAMETVDLKLSEKVYMDRKRLHKYSIDIEEQAIHIIKLHQPIAKDLRVLVTVLNAVQHINRIGRYGKDIASLTDKFEDHPHFKNLANIRQMSQITVKMIQDTINAFEKEDIFLIQDISKRDDEVDSLRQSIFRESLTYMMENPHNITSGANYIMIARYLERCGDHACGIAEKVYYLVKGDHIEFS